MHLINMNCYFFEFRHFQPKMHSFLAFYWSHIIILLPGHYCAGQKNDQIHRFICVDLIFSNYWCHQWLTNESARNSTKELASRKMNGVIPIQNEIQRRIIYNEIKDYKSNDKKLFWNFYIKKSRRIIIYLSILNPFNLVKYSIRWSCRLQSMEIWNST